MKAKLITWFLAAVYVTGSPDDTALHIASCVSTISESYFPPRRLLALDARGAEIVSGRLHRLSIWPILLLPKQGQHNIWQKLHEKASSYVFLTDIHKWTKQLLTAYTDSSWNPRARFLVIVTDLETRTVSKPAEVARRILASLWDRKVVNAAILLATSQRGEPVVFDVYTWFPFQQPENCASEVLEVTLLDRWSNGSFLHGANLYPEKIAKNLHGCPLRVAVFLAPPFVAEIAPKSSKDSRFDGLEVQLLQTLSRLYNFSIIYHPVPNTTLEAGVLLPNGTWTGVFKELVSGEVNISIGCLMPTVDRYRAFDFTQDYFSNAIVWVVPKAKAADPWHSLYKIFTPLTWLVLVLVYLIVGLVIWLLACRSHAFEPSSYMTLSSAYQIVLGMHLAVSAHCQPRTNLLRMFFILTAFYSLWIDTAYQSSLISSLTQVNTVKQITTLSEILDSDLDIGVQSDYNRLFQDDDTADQKVLERIVAYCENSILSCLKRVSNGRLALLGNRASVQLYKDGRGRTPFRLFRSDAFTYFVGMAMPKGSIFHDPFNDAIRRLNQAHFVPRWRLELSKRFKAHSIKKPKYIAKKIKTSFIIGPQRLTVNHLKGSFVLLFLRCALAMVVFLAELAVKRFHVQPQPQVLPFMH